MYPLSVGTVTWKLIILSGISTTTTPREIYGRQFYYRTDVHTNVAGKYRGVTLDLWFYIGYAALMTVESPISPGYKPNEKELLETFFLMTLEEHDGLCLDNQPERMILAVDLAAAITSAAKEGVIDLARLLESPPLTW